MTASVLDSVTFTYQPVWNAQRTLGAVALHVRPLVRKDVPEGPLDARHLLDEMRDRLPHDAPPVLLVVQTARMLVELLDTVEPPPAARAPVFATSGFFAPTVVVAAGLLERNADVAAAVRRAARRGLPLVWQGSTDRPPAEDIKTCFQRYWLTLPPPWAAAALQDAMRPVPPGDRPPPGRLPAGHIFGGIESRTLMEYCLDRCGAVGIAGWPAEDVVYSLRHTPAEPDHAVVLATLKALESDRSAEAVQDLMAHDPLLVYRFLIFANSPGLGLRNGVESVRHGMMMLGFDTLRSWLGEQLPHASREAALQPIKAQTVIRARLMDRLIDAGVEDTLRREVTMCGLFSGLDLLLDEPLATILARLPVSGRVRESLVQRTGPYAGELAITIALESPDTEAVRKLCDRHDMEAGDVNRALLDVVGGLQTGSATV